MAEKFLAIVSPKNSKGRNSVGSPAHRQEYLYSGSVRLVRTGEHKGDWEFCLTGPAVRAPDLVYVSRTRPDLAPVPSAVVILTDHDKANFTELCAACEVPITWADESDGERARPYWRKLPKKKAA